MNFEVFDALFKPSAPANAKRIFLKVKQNFLSLMIM